jgi:hypothetical protein
VISAFVFSGHPASAIIALLARRAGLLPAHSNIARILNGTDRYSCGEE